MSPRILLIEEHPVIRQALRRLLESKGLEVVGEASKGEEAHRLARELRADVVVLGVTRPFANCLSVARGVLRASPETEVILVAFEDYFVAPAFEAGIRGYVLKTQIAEELPQAIQKVAGGSIYISPEIRATLVKACLAENGDVLPATQPLRETAPGPVLMLRSS